jgi:hypothetical protein
MEVNRWVLFWSGLLMVTYCVAFVRAPSFPAVFSLVLDTRFLFVMLFFMFMRLDDKHTVTLIRLMLWSVGSIAIYGLIQYFWDYGRLLTLVHDSHGFVTDGQRRLYSYSLNVFDPAYAAVIAILILFSGVARNSLRAAWWWVLLLLPCLLLTYTRSAYLGLLVGITTLSIIDRTQLKRAAVVGIVGTSLICGVLLFGGGSARRSSLGERLQSITSQNDESSLEHKESMRRAVQVISANLLGIGLGKDGAVNARFVGIDEAPVTEDWTLQVAKEAGVIAACSYIGLTVAILWSLLRRRCRDTHTASLLAVAVSVLTAKTIAGVMIPVWDPLIPAVYTWALAGMALAACGSRTQSSSLPKQMAVTTDISIKTRVLATRKVEPEL